VIYCTTEATVSPCGLYRYDLTRVWRPDLDRVVFCMLNPSTADGTQDDPTIRRCVGFADAWGYGGLVVVNLFALRATDPKQIFEHYYTKGSPVGPDNDRVLLDRTANAPLVVAAWGVHGVMLLRDERVRRLFREANVRLHHLGITKDGHPRHPLYLKADCRPIPFSSPEVSA
jgi:hypothetical protein